MAAKHPYLRMHMTMHDMNGADMARLLGISSTTYSYRLCGKTPWTITEMYKIMDTFGIDYSEMSNLFPNYNGRYANENAAGNHGGGGVPAAGGNVRRVGYGSNYIRPIRSTVRYRFDDGGANRR